MSVNGIGETVRNIRSQKGITLQNLSTKTGLSTGLLSQFERGISTIAIDSLYKIADVLDTDISSFINSGSNNSNVILRSYEPSSLQLTGNHFITKSLANCNDRMDIYPRLISILPQEEIEAVESYPHNGEEFIYILEGILTFNYNNETFYLYPEDSAHYKSTVPHNWSNNTNKLVKFLSVSYPNPLLDID